MNDAYILYLNTYIYICVCFHINVFYLHICIYIHISIKVYIRMFYTGKQVPIQAIPNSIGIQAVSCQ